jgi:hypothetical protein
VKKTDLLRLIRAGEGTTVEFKRQLNVISDKDKREFAKDLSAMANSVSERGYLIYGVTDDKKIEGITQRRGMVESLIQISSSRINPPVDFDPIWVEINGVSVLTLEVPESRKRPHWITITRDVFIRRNKVIEKAYPDEIASMKSGIDLEETEDQTEKNRGYLSPTTLEPLDTSFFIVGGNPTHYRTSKKSGPYSYRYSPTVFDPQLDVFQPTPQFGETKSAISFEADFFSDSVQTDNFLSFLQDFEQSIPRVAADAQIWDRQLPMYWSFSREEDMDYGVGSKSASLAIHENLPKEGVLACVVHFSRFNVYKPTGLLLFYADLRPSRSAEDSLYIDACWMRMMISSLPFNPKWVQEVFQTFHRINNSFDASREISDVTMQEVNTVEWVTTRKSRLRSRIFGFMGRKLGSDPEYDQPLGLVVDMTPFRNVRALRDDDRTWNFVDRYDSEYKEPPTRFFEEIPLSVTNPVPHWLDIQSGYGNFGRLRVRQIIVGASAGSGRIMSVVSVHSVGMLNEQETENRAFER